MLNSPVALCQPADASKMMSHLCPPLGYVPDFTVDAVQEPEPTSNSAEPVTPSGLVENLDTPPVAKDAPRFIPAESFEGSRPGYVFTKGDQGLGYYVDDFAASK